MKRILIAACALLLLVVLPGVVIKRGPGGGGSGAPSGAAGGDLTGTYPNPTVETGDGGTSLKDLFYMGPNADELCIDPDTDEDATVPDACDIAITPTGIDVAAGATGQCWTLKEGTGGGAITHQWCVPDSIDNGAVTGQFDDDTTPFDSGVLKCKDWTYINPAVPVDHYMMTNLSGAVLTIVELGCIVVAGTSVALDVEACDADGTNCTSASGSQTCDTNGLLDTTFTDATLADGEYWFMNYGTVTGAVTSVTVTMCYTQAAID